MRNISFSKTYSKLDKNGNQRIIMTSINISLKLRFGLFIYLKQAFWLSFVIIFIWVADLAFKSGDHNLRYLIYFMGIFFILMTFILSGMIYSEEE